MNKAVENIYSKTKSLYSRLHTSIARSPLRTRHLFATLLCVVTLMFTHALLYEYRQAMLDSSVKSSLYMVLNKYAAEVRKNPNDKKLWPSVSSLPQTQISSSIKVVIYNADREVWRSGLYQGESVPAMPRAKDGQNNTAEVFSTPDNLSSGVDYYRMRSTIIAGDEGSSKVMHILVFAYADPIRSELQLFGLAVWGSALLSVFVVLVTAAVTIKWSMAPIDKMRSDVDNIRTGSSEKMDGIYPVDVSPVVSSINQLLEHEKNRQKTQEQSLSNLAHSLKTPLAVIRTTIEQGPYLDVDDVATIQDQVERMSEHVSYQLSMALRANRSTFQKPVEIEPAALAIASSLEKIYTAKSAFCEFEVVEGTLFYGDPGDLQELLGNLLENAFKWCSSRVLLSVYTDKSNNTVIQVDDDGPGIPEDRVEDIMNRGSRADELTPGHGLGLSIVKDIATAYSGVVDIKSKGQSGGASFTVILPQPTAKAGG